MPLSKRTFLLHLHELEIHMAFLSTHVLGPPKSDNLAISF